MLNEHYINYEITPLTLAIIPKENQNGTFSSSILETTREYVIHDSPRKVMDDACKYFGSSLKGRIDGTRDVSNITHKPPIAIDPTSGIYFFPTASPTNAKCIWVSHSHYDYIKSIDAKHTEIYFTNGKSIIVQASYGSLMNQINRTAQFRFALDHRINTLHYAMEKQAAFSVDTKE